MKDENTTHTPGQRAALAYFNDHAPNFPAPIARDALPRLAAIIDRETAAPELLAALQKIDANAAESVEWIRRVARIAIAKAVPA